MKGLVQFITEAANTTAIVNKIKKALEKEFGKKVTLGTAKANFQQLYDVYVYSMDIEDLRKVNDILKKRLPIWKGYTEDELKNLIDEKQKFFDDADEGYERTLDNFPIEFLRFTSRDLRKMLNESMIDEAITKLTTPFEKLCKYSDTDPSKEVWVLTRHVKNNFMKLKHFDNGDEAEAYIDTLRDGKSEDGYYQGMSNDEEKLKNVMKLQTFRKYKKIFESCGGAEHKIVKDAAGNWRIKGTPGNGTNTDKEGLWAAKYKTEEDAKKALAAYHLHKVSEASSETRYHANKNGSIQEGKNTFTLSDSERNALAEFLGIVTGNLGEESEIKKYEGLFKSLENGEFDKLSDIYDFLDNSETYPNVTSKNFQYDERQLVKKCIVWAEENGLIDDNWDLIDAAEKIS